MLVCHYRRWYGYNNTLGLFTWDPPQLFGVFLHALALCVARLFARRRLAKPAWGWHGGGGGGWKWYGHGFFWNVAALLHVRFVVIIRPSCLRWCHKHGKGELPSHRTLPYDPRKILPRLVRGSRLPIHRTASHNDTSAVGSVDGWCDATTVHCVHNDRAACSSDTLDGKGMAAMFTT